MQHCKRRKICPAGHPLKEVPYNIRCEEKLSNAPGWQWICDSCENMLELEGSRFRCDQWNMETSCDFDLCGECFYSKEADMKDKYGENGDYQKHVIGNVEKLLLDHVNGIHERLFACIYKDAFDEVIDFEKLGCNFQKFLDRLAKTTTIELTYSDSRLMIKPNKELLSRQFKDRADIHPLLESLDLGEHFWTTMSGVRKQVAYPHNLQEGDNLDILVTEVISPGKFWFHLRGEETSEALDKLMDDMEAFYENNGEDFRLENPLTQCKSGAIMAAPYRNFECYDFHRVLISEVCPNDVNQIKVFYVDYGTVRKIPISSVRVLHEKFTDLPAQALEAKLCDLTVPTGGNKWSKEATRRFYELVKPTSEADWGCFAIVKRIQSDASSGILHLELYDTLTNNFPRGLCINQQLVHEGFALNEERTNVEKNVTLKTLSDQEDNDRISDHNDLNNNLLSKLSQSKKTKEQTNAEHGKPKAVKKTRYLVSRVNLIGNTTETLVLIYKKKIWLSSGDIASLMPTWKGKDILVKMLEVRKVRIKSFNVAQENSEKFEQLFMLGMKPNERNEFTFYPLNKVSTLVDMFNKDIEKVKKINEAIEEAITKVKLTFGIDD